MDTKKHIKKQSSLKRQLQQLGKSVDGVEEAYRQIREVADLHHHAKSGGYEKALGRAGTAIRSAREVVEHEDAGVNARGMITRANNAKTDAVSMAHQPKPDWIGAMMTLDAVSELARQAQAEAERDIGSAEEARQRAARRRRDEEDRRRRQRDDDSSDDGYGGGRSSSSNSSGGVFGGFGGGNSGGGGATGSW